MRDYVHEHFAKHPLDPVRPPIKMKNGNRLSVQASHLHYSAPKELGADRYTSVEVWNWNTKRTPKLFAKHGGTEDNPAGYVPVCLVNQYISKNGGIEE